LGEGGESTKDVALLQGEIGGDVWIGKPGGKGRGFRNATKGRQANQKKNKSNKGEKKGGVATVWTRLRKKKETKRGGQDS